MILGFPVVKKMILHKITCPSASPDCGFQEDKVPGGAAPMTLLSTSNRPCQRFQGKQNTEEIGSPEWIGEESPECGSVGVFNGEQGGTGQALHQYLVIINQLN
jgi:hypothetical protein